MNMFARNISVTNFEGRKIKTGGFVSGLEDKISNKHDYSKSKKDEIELVNLDDYAGGSGTNTTDGTTITELDENISTISETKENTKSPATKQESKSSKALRATLNGFGLASISVGAALAKSPAIGSVMKSNPYIGQILGTVGLCATLASDGGKINSNTLYGLLSCTGAEGKLNEFLNKSLSGGVALGAVGNVYYGSISLAAANTLVGVVSGQKPVEVLKSFPQTILESTVWTVVESCVGGLATALSGSPTVGKMAGTTCASLATQYCTAPFTDKNGNVSQKWCGLAEGGILGGLSISSALVTAGVATGPVGFLVTLLGAAAGYGIVEEAKYKYDSVMNGTSTDGTYDDYLKSLTTQNNPFGASTSTYDDYLKSLYTNNSGW